MTRAKHSVFLVGHYVALTRSKMWGRLIEILRSDRALLHHTLVFKDGCKSLLQPEENKSLLRPKSFRPVEVRVKKEIKIEPDTPASSSREPAVQTTPKRKQEPISPTSDKKMKAMQFAARFQLSTPKALPKQFIKQEKIEPRSPKREVTSPKVKKAPINLESSDEES